MAHRTVSSIRPSVDYDVLSAAVTFLDLTGSGNMDAARLVEWFEEHGVALGDWNASIVAEPDAGAIRLSPPPSQGPRSAAQLARVLATARRRVVEGLRAFVTLPSDDKFIRGAIFRGDVRREDSRWVARPRENAALSAVVLSLFAAAILSHRELFDAELCICDTCGKVSFSSSPSKRHECPLHAPRSNRTTQRLTPHDLHEMRAIQRAG